MYYPFLRHYFFLLSLTFLFAGCRLTKTGLTTESNKPEFSTLAVASPSFGEKARESAERLVDLLHTKLDLEVFWEDQSVTGFCTLALTPFRSDLDSFEIHALGLYMHDIALFSGTREVPFRYRYDAQTLWVLPSSPFKRFDTLVLQIKYTARPHVPFGKAPLPARDEKGLYFINPLGALPYMPTQLWTQGETSNNRRWFPTIDHPNERCTQEVYITVESKYRTLSNGQLVYSMHLDSGKRRDYWRQNVPHAPYLCMLAVGPFEVVAEKVNDLEVSYWVDSAFKPDARAIFGNTPSMIRFFENILGTSFPWEKYAQVIVHQFVSGAMENTSASVFMQDVQMTQRELLDHDWDFIIAHELFHQWFGNLVTCESWSHLTLNEALANYAEYIWAAHKEGPDAEVHNAYVQWELYLSESRSKQVPIVRFNYDKEASMFDNHTYAKGGLAIRYLHYLLGDEVFYESLKVYLRNHRFNSVELHDLRLSFEEVSGKDLRLFFDQWFLTPGHPLLRTSYNVSEFQGLSISIDQEQTEKGSALFSFELPVYIRENGIITHYKIKVSEKQQSISLPQHTEPDWVIFDPDKRVPAEILQEFSDEQLYSIYSTLEQSGARIGCIRRAGQLKSSSDWSKKLIVAALKDPYWHIREQAISCLEAAQHASDTLLPRILKSLVTHDPKSTVRAEALSALHNMRPEIGEELAIRAVEDSSYQVVAEALQILFEAKSSRSDELLFRFLPESNGRIVSVLAEYISKIGTPQQFHWFVQKAYNTSDSYVQFLLISQLGKYVSQHSRDHTEDCIRFLQKWANEPHAPFTKLAVFQSLVYFKEREDVKLLIQELLAKEQDPASKAILKLYE
jgi:aminopeptidase N